jgi:hypothetical protein
VARQGPRAHRRRVRHRAAGVAPAIVTTSLPDGVVGQPYSSAIAATGTPSPTLQFTAGSLPPGLSFAPATGAISGTPTQAGAFTFSVAATNGVSPDATRTFTLTITEPPAVEHYAYLPLVAGGPARPDLVGSVQLEPNKRVFAAGEPVEVRVTITNVGSAPSAPAWADLFINPSAPPTRAGMIWYEWCGLEPCHGIAWAVPALAPGQSVTLVSAAGSYSAGHTIWPGWFAHGTTDLYLYVDSYKSDSGTGAVLESDEANNRAELHGLSVTGANPSVAGVQSARELPARPNP